MKTKPKERIAEAKAYLRKHPLTSIAKTHRLFNLSRDIVREIRIEIGLPENKRPASNKMVPREAEFSPTEAEIKTMTAAIRMEWDRETHIKRSGGWFAPLEFQPHTVVVQNNTLVAFERVG